MVSHFFVPPRQASIYALPKKPTEIYWLRYDNNVHTFVKRSENPNSTIGREF